MTNALPDAITDSMMDNVMLESPAAALVTSIDDVVAYLRAACTPRRDWRIGVECETFMYQRSSLRPLGYEGNNGVRAFLEAMQSFGWRPRLEDGLVIALARGDASITLEPGGQVELSSAPADTLAEVSAAIGDHLLQASKAARSLDVGLLGIGFLPQWRREDMLWMPKQRYAIMRRYMPGRGALGLDMMQRSCATQVSLDFDDEERMIRQARLAQALQPLATALFANSPFSEGRANGWLSYRSRVWDDTDPQRCGALECVFDDDFGFRRYAEFILDAPMYFVRRGGRYLDAAGQSLRDFMEGRLPALPGAFPTEDDLRDHLTTIFTDIRLKNCMEIRCADGGGPPARMAAATALWTGLLYDDRALEDAWLRVKNWPAALRARLRNQAPLKGLATAADGADLGQLAVEIVQLARGGLKRLGENDRFLDILEEQARRGRTPADALLACWRGDWGGDMRRLYEALSY